MKQLIKYRWEVKSNKSKKMCGRTCLTLQPDEILCACKYKISNPVHTSEKNTNHVSDIKKKLTSQAVIEKMAEESGLAQCEKEQTDLYIKPEWRAEFNCGKTYVPSYNIAPTEIMPVLVSSEHFSDEGDKEQTRVVVPMMWGMIPFWHKGDYKKHGLTTNNCRLEHLLESKLYAGPFRRGQRCVVVCEGFYEWQTTKTAKPSERAVHLIFAPQKDGIKIYDKKTWSPENVNLLKMAGLFDVWTDENGDKIYSFAVITYESSKILSWMHHRMPAILETEQQVQDWLDFKHVPDKVALAALRPATILRWHRVSNIVNNSRNKSTDCNKPIELTDAKKAADSKVTPKNKTLLSWLNVRKRREESLAAQTKHEESDKSIDSGSDIETPVKRPRFRDFKKSLNELNYVLTDSGDSLISEKPIDDDSSKSKEYSVVKN